MDFLKSTAKREIFFGVVYLLLGIYFVLSPSSAFTTIGVVFSIVLLIIGIINICSYFTEKNFMGIQKNSLAYGLVLSILSIYFLIKPAFIASLIGFIIGFMIIIAGITQLQNAIDLLHFKEKNWIFMLISAGILIILGIIALINPFKTDKALIFTAGIFIIISAAIKLVSIFMLLWGARSVKKAATDDDDEVIVDAAKDDAEDKAEEIKEEIKEEKKEENKEEKPVFNDKI